MLPSSRFRLMTAFLALFSLMMSMSLLMRSGTLAASISLKGIDLSPVISPVASPTHTSCGSWNVAPNPYTGELYSIIGISANDLWAVGAYNANPSYTLIEHWDGTSWSVVSSPNLGASGNILDGVAAVSINNIWAVGYYYLQGGVTRQTLIEHWDGTSWSVVSSPNLSSGNNYLYGVAAVSANDLWAVGTLIEHWDGTSWSVVSNPNGPPSGTLYGLTVLSAKNIWAVGTYVNNLHIPQTLIEHWDGTSWSVVSSPNMGSSNNVLFGIARVPSTSNLWAVGYYNIGSIRNGVYQALIEEWKGSGWKIVTSPNVGSYNNSLLGLTALSKSNVWAVGFSVNGMYQTLIEHWDGTSWSVVSSPNSGSSANTLYAIGRVPGMNNVWAVGSYNTGGSVEALMEFHC